MKGERVDRMEQWELPEWNDKCMNGMTNAIFKHLSMLGSDPLALSYLVQFLDVPEYTDLCCHLVYAQCTCLF